MPKQNQASKQKESRAPKQRGFGKSNISNAESTTDVFLYLHKTLGNQAVQRVLNSNAGRFNRAKIAIQPKLKISHPSDPFEQEADRVAEQVMQISPENNTPASIKTDGEVMLGRKCSKCQMQEDKKDSERVKINRKSSYDGSPIYVDAHEINNVVSTGGTSLAASTRVFMESRFGYDFENIRIHTDAVAVKSAYSVNALAYTVGNDIVFAEGKYQTSTEAGRRLLAHELTHTVQQNSNPSPNLITRKADPNQGEQTVQVCVAPPDPNGEWATEDWLYQMRREPKGSNRVLLALGREGPARGRSVELLHQTLLAWQCQNLEESEHGITISEYQSAEYREGTREVVRDFQKWAGIAQDGVVGPATIEILDYKVVGGPPHVSEAPYEAESQDGRQQEEQGGVVTDEMEGDIGSEQMWLRIIGGRSATVGKMARVKAERGVRLRARGEEKASHEYILPFNELVYVQRMTEFDWCWVVSMGTYRGKTGFCEKQFLYFDPPEPTANLYRVENGDTLSAIAARYYGKSMDEENNVRLYVQALYIANKGRSGVYLDKVNLDWTETLLRSGSEEETIKIYKSVKVVSGNVIWVPSERFIAQLKAQGLVTSGSTEVMKAWRKAKEIVSDVIWGAKYLVGFIVGLLEGAWNAIIDLFEGAADMIKTVAEVLYHLITGNPSAIKDMLMGWVEKLKKAWEHRDKIADDFMRKWEAADGWDRGRFQGEVLGWVVMNVLIIIVTAGAGALAQIPGRWASVVRVLRAVDALGDVTTYFGAAVKAVKLPGKITEEVSRKLGRAEHVAGEILEEVGKVRRLPEGHELTHRGDGIYKLCSTPTCMRLVLSNEEVRLLDSPGGEGKAFRERLGKAASLQGKIASRTFGRIEFGGLVQNRPLSELTHHEIYNAFRSTQLEPTNHAIMRFKHIRTRNLGMTTLNDFARYFNHGVIGLVDIHEKSRRLQAHIHSPPFSILLDIDARKIVTIDIL